MVDKSEQLQLLRTAEELKSAADARTAGVLNTQDGQFAFAVSEFIRDFFFFVDEHEEEIEHREREATDSVRELEYELEDKNDKLARIRRQVIKARELDEIGKILDEG